MQPYNVYAIGQTAILEARATNGAGEPAAPINPKILLLDPNGAETSLSVELSEDDEGLFFHELYLEGPPGLYTYRMLTSTDAEERTFYVKASGFAAPLG